MVNTKVELIRENPESFIGKSLCVYSYRLRRIVVNADRVLSISVGTSLSGKKRIRVQYVSVVNGTLKSGFIEEDDIVACTKEEVIQMRDSIRAHSKLIEHEVENAVYKTLEEYRLVPGEVNDSGLTVVPLEDCPIGLFICQGTLALKTEYRDSVGRCECYIIESGERFCGDDSLNLNSTLVTPVEIWRQNSET